MSKKLIITAALTGSHSRKEVNPYVPYTPDEVADAAAAAVEAGAAIAHIHTRSASGAVDHRTELFVECIQKVKKRSDALVSVTTGGGGRISAAERISAITGCADAGSPPEIGEVNLGSLDLDYVEESGKLRFGEYIFQNTYSMVTDFVDRLTAKGIKPGFCAYDGGHLANLEYLLKVRKSVAPPVFLDLLFRGGSAIGGLAPSRSNFFFMLDSMKTMFRNVDLEWEVITIGMPNWTLATYAILEGGHVRVGLEDYAYMYPGQLAKGSAEMVSKVKRLANELGRSVATPAEAREILGIKG